MDPKQCLNDCSAWIVASFQKRNRGLERLTQNLPRPHSQWWQSWDPISGLKDPVFWPWPTWPHLTCSGAGVSLVTPATPPPPGTFPNKSPPMPILHTWLTVCPYLTLFCKLHRKLAFQKWQTAPRFPHGSLDKVNMSLAAWFTLPLPSLLIPPFSGFAIVRQIYTVVSATPSSVFSVRYINVDSA